MKNLKTGIACTALAAVLAVGGLLCAGRDAADVPELVSYVDENLGETVQIEEDETPLASKPVVKTKTSTKTETKKYKMKTKAKKTKSSSKTSTKTGTKTSKSSSKKVVTKTTVKTTVKTSYKKKSNIKTVKTTTKTTVQTTTTAVSAANTVQNTTVGTSSSSSSASSKKGYVDLTSIAPNAHSNVKTAFQSLNYKVLVDPSVSYSGQFSANNKLITVHTNSDEAIYHELGHFVAFVSGNMDTKSEFKSIFEAEKGNFTATRGNRAYIISSASEYFAESYQDLIERPGVLQSERPQTYAYLVKCVNKVTTSRVNLIKTIYG